MAQQTALQLIATPGKLKSFSPKDEAETIDTVTRSRRIVVANPKGRSRTVIANPKGRSRVSICP